MAVDPSPAPFMEWLIKTFPWLGFLIMSVSGGVVNYLRAYETSTKERTRAEHFWAVIRLSIMSGFSGVLTYQAASAMELEASPWSYFFAGFCGMFAAKFFDVVWFMGVRFVAKHFKLELTKDEFDEISKRKDKD